MINTTVQHSIKPHDVLVSELVNRYESEGYVVTPSPSKSDLPPFLQSFHPDLFATRPDSSLVVEVRSKGKVRRSDYWRELQSAAHAYGWQLELFVNAPSEERESLSTSEVESILDQVQSIANSGALRAAVVLLWSAIEASARIALEKYNYSVSEPATPRALVTTLFSNGLVDRNVYEALLRYSEKRNHIAHGYRESATLEDVTDMTSVVRELLAE